MTKVTKKSHGLENQPVKDEFGEITNRVYNVHARRQGVRGDVTLLNIRR